MGIKVTNNAYGTLSASITSSATTIALATGQGARFPSLSAGDYFFGTLIDTSNNVEIVKVTARSSDTMTVVRGQDNTTARAYSTNDRFELRPTAALFNDLVDRIAERLALTGGVLTGNLSAPKINLLTGSDAISMQTTGGSEYWKIYGAYSDGNFYLATRGANNPAGGGSDMLFVTKEGYVRMPQQPAWRLRGPSSGSHAGSATIRFATQDIMRGCSWNTSTYRVTVPVTGYYQINVHVNMRGADSQTNYGIGLAVNGAAVSVQNYTDGPSVSWQDISFSTILALSANDAVSVFNVYSQAVDIDGSEWCGFSGHLIG